MTFISNFDYRGFSIEQTTHVAQSARFDNAVTYVISIDGREVNAAAHTMVEALRWIDKAAKAA